MRENRTYGSEGGESRRLFSTPIISSLAEMTGRKPGNLSRTLKTMSNYGIVEMKREKNHVRPIAKGTDFCIVTA